MVGGLVSVEAAGLSQRMAASCPLGMTPRTYVYDHYQVKECNSNTSIQDNQFQILDVDNQVLYQVSAVSTWYLDGDIVQGGKPLPIDAFTNQTAVCSDQQHKLDGQGLYLLSRVPGDDQYCYVVSGRIRQLQVQRYTNDWDFSVYATIHVPQQPLYRTVMPKPLKMKQSLRHGTVVEVLEQEGNWVKIQYHGARLSRAWVPVQAVFPSQMDGPPVAP